MVVVSRPVSNRVPNIVFRISELYYLKWKIYICNDRLVCAFCTVRLERMVKRKKILYLSRNWAKHSCGAYVGHNMGNFPTYVEV